MRADWKRRLPTVQRFNSGIPVATGADAIVVALQPPFVLAMLIFSVMTVDPLGWSGRGLYGTSLLAVNAVLALTRTVPDRLIGPRLRLAVAVLWAIPAGLLFAFAPGSFAISFSFMLVVHAGYRFSPAVAIAIAVVTGGAAAVALIINGQAYWWTAFFVAVSVSMGMLRRNRQVTLQAAHELVEQTRLAAEAKAKAQTLAERARIARDMHDVLAHSLSGVNMQLSMADALFDAGRAEQGREAVRLAQRMVVDGLGEARRAVHALREDVIEAVPAIRAMLIADHERFEVSGDPRPMDVTRTQTLLRTAQEALTNARRHAPGAPVLVAVRFVSHEVSLEVTNGRPAGAIEPAGSGSGMGLIGMRERAALVGATVTTGPVTDGEFDGGWWVLLTIPVGAGIAAGDEAT